MAARSRAMQRCAARLRELDGRQADDNTWLAHEREQQRREEERRRAHEQRQIQKRGKKGGYLGFDPYDDESSDDGCDDYDGVWQQPGPINTWALLEPLLEYSFPDIYDQLSVPTGARLPDGRLVYPDFLWRQWVRGDGPGPLPRPAVPAGAVNVWALRWQERKALKLQWMNEVSKEWCEDLAANLDSVQRCKRELKHLHDSSWEAVLRGARVIGCTTTGAAMFKHLLQNIKPGVVMVEEAGETVFMQVACVHARCMQRCYHARQLASSACRHARAIQLFHLPCHPCQHARLKCMLSAGGSCVCAHASVQVSFWKSMY